MAHLQLPSMAKIGGFFEMCQPYKDALGDDASWVSSGCDSDSSMFYLLNDNSDLLGDLDTIAMADIEKSFWFDSELECHRALFSYYLKYGKNYPFNGRYNELVNEAYAELDADNKVGILEVCSEVMRFE